MALTFAFIGYAEDPAQAHAYEDAVLLLLADHGARVEYRARRPPGRTRRSRSRSTCCGSPTGTPSPPTWPTPAGPLRAEHGEVFTRTELVEVEEGWRLWQRNCAVRDARRQMSEAPARAGARGLTPQALLNAVLSANGVA